MNEYKNIKTIYISNNLYNVMEHLDYLERIISLVLYSGHLKDERPLSLLIVAPTDSGKTDCVLQFSENKGVVVSTDATPYGIIRDYYTDIQKGRITHIIIPDLTIPLSDNMVRTKLVGFFTALIEEGVINISKYYRSAIPMTEVVKARCGLITCLVPEVLADKRKKWASMGFLSRTLPFSYTYSKDVVEDILTSIKRGQHTYDKTITINFPEELTKVELDYKFSEQLSPMVKELAKATGVYGFRYQRQYQTLLKAHALANGRTSVEQLDVDEIKKVVAFLNLDYKPIKVD